MFGIGTTEFLVIIVVAILVLGPEHLPRIMRTVSKVMSDFRRVSTEFQRTINLEAHQEEWQRQQDALAAKKKKKKKKPMEPAEDEAAPGADTTKKPSARPAAQASADAAAADQPADELSAEQAAASQAPAQKDDASATAASASGSAASNSAGTDAAPEGDPGQPASSEPPLQGGRA